MHHFHFSILRGRVAQQIIDFQIPIRLIKLTVTGGDSKFDLIASTWKSEKISTRRKNLKNLIVFLGSAV